jgi:3-hydroxyacyl-CoA dehydrogenase
MRLYNGPTPRKIAEAAYLLTEGHIAANTDEARVLGFIRPTDVTVYHPDRLVVEAKMQVLEASLVDRPEWKPIEGPLQGMIDRLIATGRSTGKLTEYDEVIGQKIKNVFAKAINYDEACDRERMEFAELCFRALSQARIKHMLDNRKPLRN